MKVRLFTGSLKIVEKSGVGQAVLHQKAMLEKAGIPVTFTDDKDATILHLNTVFPDSLLAARKAKKKGVTVIWYGHSTEEDFRDSFRFSNHLSSLFGRWIRFCYQQADAIITPTDYSRALLQGCGIQKPIFVLSNGVDTEQFRPDPDRRAAFRRRYGISEKEKVVISVGHFMKRKGFLDFLELARQMPDVRFLWFGYTPPYLCETEIEEAIRQAPANVSFPGFVNSEQLCEAYCGCDLFCFMSHEETEGIVVNEALACGAPVLVRDIPVYQSWLKDGREVYKAADNEQFLHKADALLHHRLPDLTEAGRRSAESRSLEAAGRKLAAIYQALTPTDPCLVHPADPVRRQTTD